MTPIKPVTREEAAEILSVSLSTLDNMIAAGLMPAPTTIGGTRRKYWHPEIFYSWLDKVLRSESESVEAHRAPPQPTTAQKVPGRKAASPMGIADRARARNAQRIAQLNGQD